MPGDRDAARVERRALAALEPGARFNEMRLQGRVESGQRPRRPHCVGQHRSAARPELDQLHGRRRSHLPPHPRRPQSEQFAEHLADLRRSDEIAGAPERIAGHVVAMLGVSEAERHVARDRDRPARGDDGAQLGFERGHRSSPQASRSGGRRSAMARKTSPARNIGIDSSMPIVNPPHRKPSCASGSRKNSQNARISA